PATAMVTAKQILVRGIMAVAPEFERDVRVEFHVGQAFQPDGTRQGRYGRAGKPDLLPIAFRCFAAGISGDGLIGGLVDVLIEEADGAVAEQEVAAARVE